MGELLLLDKALIADDPAISRSGHLRAQFTPQDAQDSAMDDWKEDDWWSQSLKKNTAHRQAAHRKFNALPVEPSLCDVCKSIDFGYLFFGDPATGYRRDRRETLSLGSLPSVSQRASDGCPFCRDIAIPTAQTLLERLRQSGKTVTPDRVSVQFSVNDIRLSRDVPRLHRSNGLYMGVALHRQSVGCDASTVEDEKDIEPPICLMDHELSTYRELKPLVELEDCKKWLQGCCDQHDRCNQIQEPRFDNPRFKLIDVQRRRIVQTGSQQEPRYATLSYVWGPVTDMWTLTDRMEWMEDGEGMRYCVLPDQLPQTIEDAIRVTHGLDLPYLWVDAVCIIQNDADDKQAQIGAMYHIYAEAHVNIVAASGENAHSGLPGVSLPRPLPGSKSVRIRQGVSVGIPQPPLTKHLQDSKWRTRAWTYQELILSRRSLFFTEREAFWYCGFSLHKESAVYGGEGEEDYGWGDGDADLIGNASVMRAKMDREPDMLGKMYVAAVEEYTVRQLSYQSDGLNAFYGMSTYFSRLFQCEMIYGCPKRMLVECLKWSSPLLGPDCWPERRQLDGGPLFPSWAWVAWKCAVNVELRSSYFWNSQIKILEPSCFTPIPYTPALRQEFAVERVDNQEHLGGILPVVTKMGRCQLVGLGLQGFADIYTLDGSYMGDCDVRGCLELEEDQRLDAHVIQLMMRHRKGQASHCSAMVVRLHAWPPGSGIAEELAEQALTATSFPATARQMYTAEHEPQHKEPPCPPGLAISDSVRGIGPGQFVLATRLGTARLEAAVWERADLADTVVFLG